MQLSTERSAVTSAIPRHDLAANDTCISRSQCFFTSSISRPVRVGHAAGYNSNWYFRLLHSVRLLYLFLSSELLTLDFVWKIILVNCLGTYWGYVVHFIFKNFSLIWIDTLWWLLCLRKQFCCDISICVGIVALIIIISWHQSTVWQERNRSIDTYIFSSWPCLWAWVEHSPGHTGRVSRWHSPLYGSHSTWPQTPPHPQGRNHQR